jgi:predicted branched-subunit amino acid permease
MLATFSAIVAPQLRRWPYLLAALAAGSVALAARGLPYKLDLMLASLVGVLAGMLAESRGVRA